MRVYCFHSFLLGCSFIHFFLLFDSLRYLILDEHLRFLDNQQNKKSPSTVTVLENCKRALRESGFDPAKFKQRNGEWCTGQLDW